jgi:ABC-type glutathione transport system ATPase component
MTRLRPHTPTPLCTTFSSGLRRRLAFTAELAHIPALLVVDGRTTGVDPLARSRLSDLICDSADRDRSSRLLGAVHIDVVASGPDNIRSSVHPNVADTGPPMLKRRAPCRLKTAQASPGTKARQAGTIGSSRSCWHGADV